jgi:hypothetical protein
MSTSETFKAVSVIDDGIATERMTLADMRKYKDSRDFGAIEQYLDRNKARVFTCRELSAQDMAECMSLDDSSRAVFAFMRGVVSVTNLEQKDGVRLPVWQPTGNVRGRSAMTYEELDLFFRAEDFVQIGQVIYQRSFFRKRTGQIYPLPPLCLAQLAQSTFRAADASQSDAASSSEKPSEHSDASPDTTESGSGKAGDQ